MSTTTRILIGFLLLIAGAFYLLLDKLTDRVERQYFEAAEVPMVDAAHILASILEQHIAEDTLQIDTNPLRRAFESAHRRQFEARIYSLTKTSVIMDAYVTDANGIVIFDSDGGRAEGLDYMAAYRDVRLTLLGEYGARSTRSNEDDQLSSVMYVAAPITLGEEIIGVVSVSKPQASMFAFIEETKRQIRFWGWSILLVTMLAAVLVSHWFSSPIRKLTEYARAIHRGERVAPPEVSGPDMRTLALALEEMRDSLEGKNYVESYVQTLTHEMKSPVSAIRGASELLQEEEQNMPPERREKFLANIHTETERLENIIDRLLALSAIESRKNLETPAEIQLADVIDRVCHDHHSAIEAKDLRLEKKYDTRPVVPGDEFLLEMAIANLLQNAIDYSPPGSAIAIRLESYSEDGGVTLIIEDEGPGIPAYAKDRIFERFYSLPHPGTGRKSSGLGLCFVREAAELHGGFARLENRGDTSGARALLHLAT